MRHMQRMQMGVALGALLFCLSSTASLMQRSQGKPALAGRSEATFAHVRHTDLSQDGLVQLFPAHMTGAPPTRSLHAGQREFARLAHSVNDAVVTHRSGKPMYILMFYHRDGHFDQTVTLTDTGVLRVSGTNLGFQSDDEVRRFTGRA